MPVIELQFLDQDSHISLHVEELEGGQFQVQAKSNRYLLQLHWNSLMEGWVRDTATGAVTPFFFWSNGEEIHLWVQGRVSRFRLSTLQARRKRALQARVPHAAGGEVKAPMPGTVLKILVAPGSRVEANAPLLILESMKMEMTLSAPVAGWVSEIACETGQLVEMNAALIRLEAIKDEPVLS